MNEYVNSLPMPYDAYHEILDSIARSEELPLIAESLPEPSSSSLRQNTLLQPFNPQGTDQDTPTIMDETVPASDRQKLILLIKLQTPLSVQPKPRLLTAYLVEIP